MFFIGHLESAYFVWGGMLTLYLLESKNRLLIGKCSKDTKSKLVKIWNNLLSLQPTMDNREGLDKVCASNAVRSKEVNSC